MEHEIVGFSGLVDWSMRENADPKGANMYSFESVKKFGS